MNGKNGKVFPRGAFLRPHSLGNLLGEKILKWMDGWKRNSVPLVNGKRGSRMQAVGEHEKKSYEI